MCLCTSCPCEYGEKAESILPLGKMCSLAWASFTLPEQASPARDLETEELAWDRKIPQRGGGCSFYPLLTMSFLWKKLIFDPSKMATLISSFSCEKREISTQGRTLNQKPKVFHSVDCDSLNFQKKGWHYITPPLPRPKEKMGIRVAREVWGTMQLRAGRVKYHYTLIQLHQVVIAVRYSDCSLTRPY